MLFFLFVSLSVVYAADWSQIGHADGVKFFIDKSSISRSNGVTKAWFLLNYDTPHQDLGGQVHLSEIESLRFNCSERMVRFAIVHHYSQHNGSGNWIPGFGRVAYKPAEFVDIRPNSFEEIGFKVLCDKQ